MIDIHTHILYSTDDGARSIEESIELIKEAINAGITDIFLTPHYIVNSTYNDNLSDVQRKLDILKEHTKYLDINLHLANEVYLQDKINFDEIKLLNKNYILIELPIYSEIPNLIELIDNINKLGIKVIIAHPERYKYVIEDIEYLKPLIQIGVLFQCNIGSFFNHYGSDVKKTINKLIKKNYIHFIASDIHNIKYNTYKYYQKLPKVLTKKTIELLTKTNPNKLINNQEIKAVKYNVKTFFNK